MKTGIAGLIYLASGSVAHGPDPGVNVSQGMTEELTSTKDHSVAKVQSDPALADGRLVATFGTSGRAVAHEAAGRPDVVTRKIEFVRKEERPLRVVVELTEEQHVFELAAPGER
jgi:hypothetical protein